MWRKTPKNKASENLDLTNHQKMSLALLNSQVNSEGNASLLQQWQQHICQNATPTQHLQATTTHLRDRLTFSASQIALVNLEKHAQYYQQILGVEVTALKRLQDFGETLQPARLGSWLEINSLGVNAGWFFPVEMSMEGLLDTIKNTTHKKILTRWVNIQNKVTCVGYGESLLSPVIHQMEFQFEPSLPFTNQFHMALNLVDFLEIPPFHGQLLNILKRYEAQELVVSLWLSPQGVLKFGIRVLNPSVKLMIAFFVLAGLDQAGEDKLAVMHGIFEQIAWVELQQTADGLCSEVGYRV
ncbi:MAG TPA: hypothetical protein DCS93_16625 [Microscillaceae bacterium]|nr:hypothetical protein [Microscillaceae bacterium]